MKLKDSYLLKITVSKWIILAAAVKQVYQELANIFQRVYCIAPGCINFLL
jgi:hypothetical protein